MWKTLNHEFMVTKAGQNGLSFSKETYRHFCLEISGILPRIQLEYGERPAKEITVKGPEAKALRKLAGMSQAEFGTAIGLSRETIGRMERGSESIDRRSELAMRYIAEKGQVPLRSQQQIHEKVTAILDEAAVRGCVSYEAIMTLRGLPSDWAASDGGALGASLLHNVQGLIGIINSLDGTDPYRARAYEDLRQLKLAWAASRTGDG